MTHAVIPIKRFERAKTRLRGRLDDAERAALARRMFEHVFEVCLGCAHITGTLVLTDSDEVAHYARGRGAAVLADRPDHPETPERLGLVVDAGLAQLRAAGVDAALVLMADLPDLAPSDLDALLDGLRAADLVLAPDRSGTCTNALALRLGATTELRTRFGHPNSLSLHEARARELGLAVALHESARLALDVDLAADLELTSFGLTEPARRR